MDMYDIIQKPQGTSLLASWNEAIMRCRPESRIAFRTRKRWSRGPPLPGLL